MPPQRWCGRWPAVTGESSRNELVAAGFRDEQLGARWVLLDLLTQPVDVRLQRVRSDACVIAPDLVQQRLARDDLVTGAVEIFQDRGLFLREPDLCALLVEQELGRRLEGVRADREDCVLALLVLAQLRADAGEQHRELERL